MHICTVQGLAFQREGLGVDIYDDGAPVAYLTADGVDFTRLITTSEARWLLPIVRLLVDTLSRRTLTDDQVGRLVAAEAAYVGVARGDIVTPEAPRPTRVYCPLMTGSDSEKKIRSGDSTVTTWASPEFVFPDAKAAWDDLLESWAIMGRRSTDPRTRYTMISWEPTYTVNLRGARLLRNPKIVEGLDNG